MYDSWVLQEFCTRVPQEFLVALVRVVLLANSDALSQSAGAVRLGKLNRSSARDLFPHERRARVESGLGCLPREFPGVRVSTRFNASRNAHEILTFGPALLTESFVRDPARVPRPSRFRENYSRTATGNFDGQMAFRENDGSLVSIPCPVIGDDPGNIYGILIYSSLPNHPFTVSYIGIGFPDPRCRRYVARLPLTGLCSESSVRSPVQNVSNELDLQFLTQYDEASEPKDDVLRGR